jgi:hypothetical protein
VTTIANLVVEASLSPDGVRRGLDQALGYTRQFASSADVIFKKFGPGQDTVANAQLVVRRIEAEFLASSNRLKEQYLRGVIDQARFTSEARQAGVAMNQALLAGVEGFRSKGIFDLEAENVFISKLRSDLRDVAAETGRIGGAGGGAGFLEQLDRGSHGGAAGLGLIKRELIGLTAQLTGTMPLVDRLASTLLGFNASGAVTFGVIAGVAAIAGAYHLLTEESRKAEEENKKALDGITADVQRATKDLNDIVVNAAQGAVAKAQAKLTALEQAQRMRLSQPGLSGLPQGALSIASPDEERRARQELADANTQLRVAFEVRSKLRREETVKSERDYDAQLAALIKADNATADERRIALFRLGQHDKEAAALALSGLDNQRRLAVIEGADTLRDALFPKQKAASSEPFKELRQQVDGLTASYSALRAEGIQPTLAQQIQMENLFRRLDLMLFAIPDKANRAARSLSAMMKELLASGIHENDDLLPHSRDMAAELSAAPKGKAPQEVLDQIEFVKLLRTAYGELDDQVLRAEGELHAAMLGVNTALADRKSLSREALMEALRVKDALTTEFKSEDKGQFGAFWTPEMEIDLERSIAKFRTLTHHVKDVRTEFQALGTGVQGVVAALNAMGMGSEQLNKVAQSVTGLGNAMQRVSDVQRQRDEAKAREAQTPGSGGVMAGAMGTLLQGVAMIGVFGQAIGLLKNFAGLFSHHDAILEENNKRLDALRLSLVDTGGVGGKRLAITAGENIQKSGLLDSGLVMNLAMQRGEFDKIVNAAGLTMDQFKKMAQELGFDTTKGMAWVTQFTEALRISTRAAAMFSQSLDDQRSLMDLHNKVFGLDKPQDQITSAIALLDKFAPQLAKSLEGFDVTTEQGRKALREALKKFVTMIETSSITPEMLGTLSGVKDFAQIILTVSDALDSFGKATDKATASVTNIPPWYKLNLSRWQAANPIAQTGVNRPMLPSAPSDVRPSIPSPVTGSGGPAVVFSGDITVMSTAKDPVGLFREMLAVAQASSFTQFGTTTRWSDIQKV